MSKDLVNAPHARSWRDIPQPVKPRAMSRGGKWRLAAATLRGLAVGTVLVALAGGGWLVAGALTENPTSVAPTSRAVAVGKSELKTDGVLTAAWLADVLALPKHATLTELDLARLTARVLADGQVLTANITRRFKSNALLVNITERVPVARVLAEIAGEHQQLLVAGDGVVFAGAGFAPETIELLPWLAGVAIKRKGGQFLPIPGMNLANELLTQAQIEADHIYRSWHSISLERLASDREIIVRTREPEHLTIIFGLNAAEDRVQRELSLVQQLARLHHIRETLAGRPIQHASIDLSHGPQVPVSIDRAVAQSARAEPAAASHGFRRSPSFQSQIKREL